jgi:hypothetical protein
MVFLSGQQDRRQRAAAGAIRVSGFPLINQLDLFNQIADSS